MANETVKVWLGTESVDYDGFAAELATQFQNGNHEYCRKVLGAVSPLQAATVAVSVYGIFISLDKEKARDWDGFLRGNVCR